MSRGFDAVGERLDDAARWRWARAHARPRVLRLQHASDNAWFLLEYDAELDIDDTPASARRQDHADTMQNALSEIDRTWSSNAAGAVGRLRRLDRTVLPDQQADFDALFGALDDAQSACGWR